MRQTTLNVGNVAGGGRSNRRDVLGTLGVSLPVALAADVVTKRLLRGQTVPPAEPQSKFLSVDSVKLHYLEWRTKDARPLLLLHPAPLNSHVWDAFGPAMTRGTTA
jgi:hypothetical protein